MLLAQGLLDYSSRKSYFCKKVFMFEKEKVLQRCNEKSKNTLMETLNIEYIDAGPTFLKAKMPVNSRVHQPMGLLHGGASVALAESVGSAASIMFVNPEEQEVRGIEISANHLKAKREGTVFATATIIHQGRSIHLWEIKITDEQDNLVCLCKLTNMVLPKKQPSK
jgi:1,4-dihydroxy-2-naphthoyl-CoA hydrolase